MIIAGAGGHGLEVLQLLISQGFDPEHILFFDQDKSKEGQRFTGVPVITDLDYLKDILAKEPKFCLGVGSPQFRKKLFSLLVSVGGEFVGLKGDYSITSFENEQDFDFFPFSFLGPAVQIEKGVLINTRAHVHHQCFVGEYSEISPGAILLGGVKVGKRCRIGAGAIILPGVELGDEVVVGAGAVVTKNVPSGKLIMGVPAR
ncbi:MAG: NeuD/PglB/VioB family sugar acetyltransferase [Algoriphagus sp.]|uniref:NeuD/PglB/VioB family sugar acetyltransferase n=1 Tax=Algoriphagus sp. TaxID=1872435 RepID=UPI0017E8239A|nr:NeuD/PglB/VioB family sugar acetyltransferase [Algoriphagus sp.]NVJ86742.1 NeuD/PglB/VioB family sugar acetyltransferase [Algoriphagus sp.]